MELGAGERGLEVVDEEEGREVEAVEVVGCCEEEGRGGGDCLEGQAVLGEVGQREGLFLESAVVCYRK